MANVRKRERRMTLMSATAKVAKREGSAAQGADHNLSATPANNTPSPSPNATAATRILSCEIVWYLGLARSYFRSNEPSTMFILFKALHTHKVK